MTKQPRKEIMQKSKQQRKFNKLRTSESKKKNSTETKRNLTILKKTKTNYFSNLNLNVVQKQSPEVFYNKRCRHFLLKNRLWHRCFPMNLTNFLEHRFYRTPPDGCFLLLVIIKNFD